MNQMLSQQRQDVSVKKKRIPVKQATSLSKFLPGILKGLSMSAASQTELEDIIEHDKHVDLYTSFGGQFERFNEEMTIKQEPIRQEKS